MRIDKALEHQKWRLSNSKNTTQKDIDAYNSIIEYKEIQDSHNLSENESLAKLWIYILMLLNNSEMYSAERSIQIIDEILQTSVYDWCKKLHKNIGLMQLNVELGQEYKQAVKDGNITKIDQISKELVETQPDKVLNFLKNDVKEENIIKFVEKNISRIIQNEKQ